MQWANHQIKRLVELDENLYLNGSWGRFLKNWALLNDLKNGWYLSTFFGGSPQKSIARLNFPCPIDSIFGFWLRKLRLRCIRYIDFHLFEWKENEQIPQKNPTFAPKICQILCNRLFFSKFFVHQKKKQREKMHGANPGVSGRNWRILWMFIGGESSKVQ